MSKKPNNWAGDDTLIGTARADVLRGQGGDDLLTGGRGSDVFRFEATRSLNGFDTITDYTWGAGKKAEADLLDLSAVRLDGARQDSIGDYVWLTEGKDGATLHVDRDGPGGSAPEVWAFLEGLASGDRVRVRLDVSSACSSSEDASGNYLLTVRGDADDTAPTFGEQPEIEAKYDENRKSGDAVGTLAATDNVGVTGYRFCDGDGNDLGTTSADGFFSVDSDGTIRMTAAGAASAVNDFENGPPPPPYLVQAGDAAGNWSAPKPLALLKQDVLEVLPSAIATPFYDAEGKATEVPKASGLEFEANAAGLVTVFVPDPGSPVIVPLGDYTEAGTRVSFGEQEVALQGFLVLFKPGTTDYFSEPPLWASFVDSAYQSTIYGLGTSGSDNLTGDFVWGFGGDDQLSATQSSGTTNFLFGGAGNDTLTTPNGPTVLVGGAGGDRIFTGSGSTVVFTADGFGSPGGPDQVLDFTVATGGLSVASLAIDAPLVNAAGGKLTDGVSAEEWQTVVVSGVSPSGYSGDYQLTDTQMVLEVHGDFGTYYTVPGLNDLKDAGKDEILGLLSSVKLAAPGDEALLVIYQNGDWVQGSAYGDVEQSLVYLFHMKDSGTGADGSLTVGDSGDVIELVGVLTGVSATWLGPEHFVASPFVA